MERAVFAGGCFWGMQDLIRRRPGVSLTRVGYTGGTVPNATYEKLKRGNTGHAESIEVFFDPAKLSYRQLLEFFFQIHDPSTPDRQGNDRGSSYRSEIFYVNAAQNEAAKQVISEINASGKWPGRVTTKISKAGDFWQAEPAHQDYLQRVPNGYTCHYIRPDWVLAKRS